MVASPGPALINLTETVNFCHRVAAMPTSYTLQIRFD
jgi:hypothetical protein